MRKFNVTGICVASENYMVDISGKLDEIEMFVKDRKYFTINRARQFGKTTTLFHLEQKLVKSGEYVCASISFENAGILAFETEATFCEMFLDKFSNALAFSGVTDEYADSWLCPDVTSFKKLDRHITKQCKEKKVVLMIDEVDKSTNNMLFLHFLGMLRAKFLLRQAKKDYTFQSVILAGVTDIKNMKLKMVNDGLYTPVRDEVKIVNSPWNIAATFNVDMSFGVSEIASMLREYELEKNTGMDTHEIAGKIHAQTSGYPYLVSRICKCIDEELGRDWTTSGVNNAVQVILEEQSVFFDDMSKNLKNYAELNNFMYELLILGEPKTFNLDNSTVSLANTFGYIKKGNGRKRTVVFCKIFEARMAEFYIARAENSQEAKRIHGTIYQDVIKGNSFDMAACLVKFAEHYKEIFALKDQSFFERHGRLLFLTFLKPLLNGQGNYHIESQLTDQRRMDLVVDFEKEQHIVELKLWRGEAGKEKAFEQLLGYMEQKNANEGYLLTFDFRKERTGEYTAEWTEHNGRRVFSVLV